MSTASAASTRYRLLEWTPRAEERAGRTDFVEHWSPRGLAFEQPDGVFLWLLGWRTPLRLRSSLEKLSARDYPNQEERWRWCELIMTDQGAHFRPDKILVSAITLTAAAAACPPKANAARPASKKPALLRSRSRTRPLELMGPARRRPVVIRGPRPVSRGMGQTATKLAQELLDQPADSGLLWHAGVHVNRAPLTTAPHNVPADSGFFQDGRVSVLIGICAPVLGASGEDPPSHPHVDGWREWQRVREVLDKVSDSETGRGLPLRLVRLRPPTLEQLREELHGGRGWPAHRMAHLVGYASREFLAMEHDNGREHLVSPERLAYVFRGSEVQIALLNICFGLDFADALIHSDVASVVTTLGEISDPEATLLARELYLRLAFGDTIGEAHAWACESIIEAYSRGKLPAMSDYRGQGLTAYGRERADNVLLCGDRTVRLPLPPPGEAAARPEFDLNEPPHNLPHPDDIFVGRGRELVLISDMMEECKHRIIFVSGIGGIGKSALVLRAAQRNRWRFHRVIYFTCKNPDGCPRPLPLEGVCRRVEAVLGLGGAISCLPTAAARSQRAAEILNAHSTLLVFDSIDLLSQPEIQALAEFLQRLEPSSGSMALMTSRREDVPPLLKRSRGDRYHLPLSSLEPADSISLLAEVLKPPVDREPTAEEREVWQRVPESGMPPGQGAHLASLADRAVVPLVKVCALERLAEAAYHHPLLLSFAAADLKGLGNEWHAVLNGLANLRGEELQEQVEDKIGTMCRELEGRAPPALQLIKTLLVCSQGATREALRFIWCGRQVDDDSNEAQVFDDARRAARRSALLNFKAERYDLHPLVYQYLSRQQPQDDALHQQRCQAHAAYYLEYLRRQHRKYETLEPERPNLLRGMDWAERAAEDRMVLEYARHLFDFLWVRGYWSEGRERMRRGADAARRLGDQRSEAYLLFQRGQFCRYQGMYEEARTHYQSCLTLEEQREDLALRANTLLELGILCRYQGEHPQALDYYLKCRELEGRIQDRVLKAKILHELGVLHGLQGKYGEALAYSQESLAIEEELEDKTLMANTLHQISVQYWAQNDYIKAREYCDRALELAHELDNQVLKARLYHEYGVLKGKEGDLPEARHNLNKSLDLRERIGDRTGQAATLCFLGQLSLGEGNLDAAEDLYRRSLELADQTKNPYWRAWTHFGLGLCASERDQRELARQRFQEALGLAERLKIPLAALAQSALEDLDK